MMTYVEDSVPPSERHFIHQIHSFSLFASHSLSSSHILSYHHPALIPSQPSTMNFLSVVAVSGLAALVAAQSGKCPSPAQAGPAKAPQI
jgi:hypothetical protein